jgi:3-deoxy-manno-octulosonate cytidylyltransferase (CMP-KDO synthetase)
LAKNIDFVAVATDDERIETAVKSIGGNVFMTPDCQSGTDRIAFVAKKFLTDFDVFINVQGDEPLINPKLIDNLASELKNTTDLDFVTAAYPFKNTDDSKDPNNVKVVFDKNRNALLFSRADIPYNRSGGALQKFKHIGIYGYKRDFLLSFVNYAPSPLEQAESLEQLRALDNGHKIKIVIAGEDSVSVDVVEDILKVEALL